MTLSRDLWQANLDLSQACLEHPFVQAISSGTLHRERFAYYVSQDTFFLEAVARAYTIAAAKVSDWEGFLTFHALVDGALEEIRLHEGNVARAGVDIQNVELGSITRRYIDFLLATARGHDVGLTVVAVSPCARLYTFLGQKLAEPGIPDHQYSDWIRIYSSTAIEDLAQQLERLVDRYASATSVVRSTYRYAMQCEWDFFQAAWEFSV